MRINFELLDLRAFLAILDLGGFHKAAEFLNLSQPALSRRIQALENAVGAPLLERTTRHVAPTSAGHSFAPLARRLLGEFEDSLLAISGLGDRQAGLVTIACVPTAAFYFLPAAIEKFNALFPHIRFRILDLSANCALQSVRNGEAEFGINFIGSAEADMTFTSLLDDPFVLACHRDHKFAALDIVEWKALENETIIGVSRMSGNRHALENALAKTDVRLRFQYEVNHLTTSLGLVERGLGISILPKSATPITPHHSLIVRKLGEPTVWRTIGLIERNGSRLAPAAQRFRDMLIDSRRYDRPPLGGPV